MKKATILLFIVLFSCSGIWAQKGTIHREYKIAEAYKRSRGIGTGLYDHKGSLEFIPMINMAPQLDLTQRYSDLSLSLNSQLAIGYHIKSAGDSLGFIYWDAPLLLEVNFGHLASHDFFSEQGLFFGAGYDFNYIRNAVQHGLAFTLGGRTWILGKSFTARYIYTDFLNIMTPVHTITINMNLGDYLEQVKANNKISNFMRSFRSRE